MRHFTFGVDHPFANHYVSVDTDDSDQARTVMRSIFESHWGFEYTDSQKAECIDRFALQHLGTIKQDQNYYWRLDN